jgi:hypothetical protein
MGFFLSLTARLFVGFVPHSAFFANHCCKSIAWLYRRAMIFAADYASGQSARRAAMLAATWSGRAFRKLSKAL